MSEAELVSHALSQAAGLDLPAYRDSHVRDRVRRALEREGVGGAAQLAALLRRDEAARARFRRSVAVSFSGLFRDPAQFELLERELLPPLVARDGRIRVWSAGCADGSELYSVALLLQRLGALERAFLLGSDLLEENIVAARRGPQLAGGAAGDLRPKLRWERRDLLRDGAPAGPWRLILCRNVAIYLARDSKQRLHRSLAGALAPGGVLLLGRSERLSEPRGLGLEPVGPHAYRRQA
jgi:chemotaxis protein methyltransferase CheR